MKRLKKLNQEYLELSTLSEHQSLSDEFIFKKISELDEKYKDFKPHHDSFEGVLSNIGADQKSIKILNCAIKRLKKKKKDLPLNKYHYDLANTITVKADIELNDSDRFNYLINSSRYKEAKNTFLLVNKKDLPHFERANTNIANILEKHGRNYEALHAYDKVIEVNPNYGMALGNKAIALEYYIRLAPQQSLVLLNHSYLLLKRALKDEDITEIGGSYAKKEFENKLIKISNYFEEINYTPKSSSTPRNITKYEKFILDNNLYLNYDFGFYYDKESLKDNFFPNLTEEINSKKSSKVSIMSDKTYFCFQVFNQLIEDFTTARYNYYKAINLQCKSIDNNIGYIYTYDYTNHSLKHGMLKSAFSTLYNCLDKVAHLVNYYYSASKIDTNNINIYFDWFTTEEYKKIILREQNYQLLALYSLACDFKQNSQYNSLQIIRNRITHSFLNVALDFSITKSHQKYEISYDLLIESTKSLFIVVKSAIIYTMIAIRFRTKESETLPMLATMQSHIFK